MNKAFPVRRGWLVVLVITLLAAWFAPKKQDEGVVLTTRSSRAPDVGASATAVSTVSRPSNIPVQVLKIRDRSLATEGAGAFATISWSGPKLSTAPRVVALAPPLQPSPPVAPPSPFRVMGSYTEGDHTVVFLLQADHSWVAHEGDVIAESYKVEHIAANAVHLRYLPLDEVQVLEIGSVQ